MGEGLVDRLAKILPKCRGVWIPMDHGISSYPEKGLDNMDQVVSSCISGGADAIVLQKGALSHFVETTGWSNFVCHVSVSTVNAGEKNQYKVILYIHNSWFNFWFIIFSKSEFSI